MFENETKKSYLPGYTGYIPKFAPQTYEGPSDGPKKQIPGSFSR